MPPQQLPQHAVAFGAVKVSRWEYPLALIRLLPIPVCLDRRCHEVVPLLFGTLGCTWQGSLAAWDGKYACNVVAWKGREVSHFRRAEFAMVLVVCE